MRRRKVVFSQRSRDQLRTAKTWWIDNEGPVGILADEIEQAVDFLALLPGAGTPYPQAEITGLRRLYALCTARDTSDRQVERVVRWHG